MLNAKIAHLTITNAEIAHLTITSAEIAHLTFSMCWSVFLSVTPSWNVLVTVVNINLVGVIIVDDVGNVTISKVVRDVESLVFVTTNHSFAHEIGKVTSFALRNDLVLGDMDFGLDRVDLKSADRVFRTAIGDSSLCKHETI